MSLLDEYKQSQQQNSSGSGQQSGGAQRKSLLQEHVENNCTRGLNKNYVDSALKNGGGFGAIPGGIYQNEDGSRYLKPYSKAPTQESLWKKKYQGKSYQELKSILDRIDKDSEEYKWLDAHKHELYVGASDFEAGAKSGLSSYEAYKAAQAQEEEDKAWYEWIAETLGKAADTTLPLANATTAVQAYREDTSPMEPGKNWTDEQRNTYGYLYSIDKAEADAYALSVNEGNNQQAQEEKRVAIEEWATKNGFNMAAGTIASLVAMPLSLADTMDYLAQMVGRGYITTSPDVTPGQFANTVRGAVSEDLNENYGTLNEAIPVIGGKGWGDVYQLGTSIADSLAVGRTAGPLGTYVTFFGSASASGIENARARGATDEQAIWLGIANGLAEAAGEAFSIDKLLKTGASSTLKDFFFNILKQSGVEASEEGVTTLINNLADQLVMQDQSEFNNLVLYYTQNGMSQEEAKKQAWKDMAESLAYDMLSGFVSGGVSSGIQTGVENVIASKDAKRIYGSSAAELVEEGLELDPSNKLANKMQGRLDRGKNVSGRQLRNLAEQNQAAILNQDRASIETAAATRLTELGETGDVQAIAKALAKQAAGESLSRAEREIISKSKYGQRVSNELNPKNIRSGEYASGWAENIGTNKINADEYNRIVEAAQIREDPEEVSAAVEEIVQQTEAATIRENQIVQEPAESVAATEESSATEDASGIYDVETAKALVMDMGQSGADLLELAKSSGAKNYMSEAEIEAAYKAGQKASAAQATARDDSIKQAANGKTGRKRGTVRGDGVTITELNEFAKSNFNTTQRKAYKILDTVAEATGIDIVLYKSTANEKGEFEGAQGSFKWKENTIYIDVNSGLKSIKGIDSLEKYTMLRTFNHEFVHFIEKHNAGEYNEFRTFIFQKLTERGENVADLIEAKIAQSGVDENGKPMSYNMASREVVAEAMTDMLPQSSFVQQLAEQHKNVFETLLDKLKEFVSQLKDYFNSLAKNPSREANALKEEIDGSLRYMEDIVKMFDKMAVKAVENYQATVATEEVVVAKTETTTAETKQETEAVEETVAETTTVEVKAEPKTSTSENGYTITDNTEYNSIEITFNEKPSEAIREVLKAKKFRWNGKKKVWYGKTSHEAIMEALDQAYEAEKTAATGKENLQVEETKPEAPKAKPNPIVENTVKAAEKAADPNDPYSRLEGVMNSLPRFYTDGFLFRIMKAGKNNAYWKGEFTSATKDDGFEIVNARGPKYSSELFESRKDAVKDLIAVARNNRLLDNETQNNKEEVKADVENLDNTGTVRQPDSDRPGDTPVLEAVQTEDVPGNAQERDLVGSAAERGSEIARDDVRDDTAGHEGTRGDGSSQSGDIRRVNKLKEAQEYASEKGYRVELNKLAAKKQLVQIDIYDKDGLPTFNPIIINDISDWDKVSEAIDTRERSEATKAEELHEAVTEQIEQQSTEQPKGRNFVIDESLNLPSGAKSRFRANVDAIRLIKKLDSEGRNATAAEQVILSKYVGWGGLSEAFGELTFNRETRKSEMTPKADWEKEFAELRQLVTEGIITEEEYQAASKSTQNAHYTSVEVIRAMYEGLAQLGFKGGRMLEPSSGVGNFVGGMPASMTSQVKSWTMVELDRITGQIAKYLYPNSDVRIQGFEKANIPDNYMDVAIGNVPFGNVGVVDKAYPKRITKAIHNYFFAKSLDKVRPGGIVMFITSSFTMNGTDTAVRQYIMDRADLLGAIRLPNTAFAGNAGTQVVTDILILKKRAAGTAYAGESFLEAPYTNVSGYQGTYINEYFNNHPEMVLGTAEFARGMYGANSLTYSPLTDRGSLEEQIKGAFKHIKGKMDYQTKPSPEKANFAVERATKKTKNGGLVVNADGSISRNEDGELVKVKADAKTAKRIAGLLSIRDAYRKLANYLQQGQDAKYINQARKALNEAYDSFVKAYGYINSPANRKAIAEDPDSFAIYALENYDAEKKTGSKADIFSKDTISPNRTITHVEDIASGIIVSINQTGGVDAALIAKLTGKTEEAVTRELIDGRLAFKTRSGRLEAPESYLSGNVRAKLREAEALAPIDKDFENNVEELKKVIPADIPFHEIHVTPGSPWIPVNVYADFIAEMLGGYNSENSYKGPDVEVGKSIQGDFKIVVNNTRLKQNHLNTQKWGTKRRTFLDLIDAMMASRSITVNDQIEDPLTGNKRSVVNKVETAAAQEKVEEITKEFQDWLWRDESRRTELATLYNEVFNALVTPKYDGSNLTVNGQNPQFSLRQHQADAVQRIISSGGNTLLAHKVGAGKTLEMAAAAMKLRELGIVKKPLFVVPKSLVAQWGVEFMNYYPAAKLLVSDEKSFTKANRKTYANRIANGDYDAVIVSYEQFEKIPMSADFQREFYQEQIDEILAAIAEERAESKGKGITVKEMEKKKGQLEKKIAELTTKAKDEDNIDFEQLGVDSVFVDEAHNFKNLQYVSRMNNISGLGNKDGSQRAFDLYTKVRYLQKLNGGRGIVFATATPVMNSMAEMYIMQKYLQSDMLDQLGLKSFDAWAKQFGEVVNSVEIKPSGQGFRVKQTFSNFRNLNELQLLFRSFSDVLTKVPGLKVPKMKGGKVNVVVCEPGQFQKDYMSELEKRADNVKNVDPSVDNMLKITSDGRKVSYTQRMIDPTLPYEPGCKIYRCRENVLTEYKNSKEKKGTQIIFCDMATPKGKSKTAAATETVDDTEFDVESAKLYDDMRDYLQKKGIPAQEIAFIHEADTDQKKKKLFADVNEGKVRVLIGSTGKMGVGMNAQRRIVAIHHLDAPWRPGDVEQRDGRAFRQGNINEEVSKYTYVTEGSFDARLWDILDRKQHFINQIMNGEDVGRSAEDTGDVTLSAAEVKALASGNPLIEEHVKLTTELQKLENLKLAHNSNITRAKARLAEDEKQIASLTSIVANLKEDLKARVDTYSEGKFSMTIGKQKFTDKKEAGIALVAAVNAKGTEDGFATIGKFAGFELRVIKQGHEYKGLLFGKQGYGFNVYESNTTYGINHLITIVEGLDNRLEANQERLKELAVDREAQREIIAQPFAKQAELDKKRARFNEIMEILNPKEEQSISEEELEQHQQRIEPLTDREVLAMAASELGSRLDRLSDGEKDALRIFNQRLNRLEELENKRAEEGRLYKEQQFGAKVDREAAKATLDRMHELDRQIKKASEDVLNVENKAVLKSLLQKARKVVEQQERQHGQEILKRWRERRNDAATIKKYRDRLRGDVDELTNWVLHPNNKDVVKHVPDALKNTVVPFLASINFMSKRQLKGGDPTQGDEAFLKHMNALKSALKQNIDIGGLYSGYNDLPPDFMDNLQTFIDTTQELVKKNSGEFVINQMTGEELRELSKVVRALKKYIMQMNRFHVNAMYQHVYEAGDNAILHMGSLGEAKNTGTVSNFVLWQNIRPAYAFERFGEGGMAIYDGLRHGQSTLAFNTKKITDFAEKAYTAAEVKAWEDTVKTFKFGSDIIKIPVSGIMSLYELSKRPQALTHILGGGIRVATFKKDGQKLSDVGHTLTPNELQEIVNSLTPRQLEVADKLQQFMAKQGGEWGNYVSVKRWGEEMFGEEHYFPINSDGRHLQATADEHPSAASLYALLNMSFTKELQENANNRVILYSIFDVFANHMASMAQYNAFALPVLDALKWFNYQQKSEPDENGKRVVLSSVREQMARAYGVPEETRPGSGRQGYAESFFMNIIKAFNGTEAQGVPTDTTGINALRRYNMAQVAYNLRVVVQQPLSITRAALLVDYDSIIKGIKLKPAEIEQNIEEMQKYSGIAAWKSLGFYDINISRGITDIIKHDTTWRDKVSEIGMWGAEKADLMTWAGIWSAAKEEVIKKQRLTPASEGFYEAVTKLFEDIIYKTQVVDSVLTKNEYLRSKGFFTRAIGSFMSEPSATASMLIDAFDKFSTDMNRGMTRQQAWKKNGEYIVRVAYVYGIGAVLLAAVQAVADAWRDDDDYQSFLEKWLEAFGGNFVDELMPANKLPILSDFYDVAKELLSILGVDTYGTPPQSVFMQWWDSLAKGVEILYGKIQGKENNYTWYGGVFKLLQAASGISGLPMAAAVREISAAWNNTVGAMAPSLKVKSYEASEKNQIKYAYQDGWLNEEDATSLLLEKGVAADENEAYWMVQEWMHTKGDSDWSRFDKLYEAMLVGDKKAFAAAQEELGDHGIAAGSVRNEAKNQIKRWYQAEEQQMDKQTAIKALQNYAGLSRIEAEHEVDKWSSLVVTGIAYEDISEEYIKGNITEYRAKEMLEKYGHMYYRDAEEKVREWQMEKDTGLSYSKLSDAYIHDDITEYQAIDYLMKYGQLSQEEAEAKILDWQAAKDYGVTLGSSTEGIKKALIEGYISAETAKTIMMVYDGKTAEEAEDYVNQYLFTAETGYSFSEIEKAYADGVISKADMVRWYRDASLYTHGSEEIAKEYAEVADWKANVLYGESMNRDGLEKWEKYGSYITRAGLGKADFARAWGIYNAAESQYDSQGNKTKEKAQVFFEDLYDLHLQGVYTISEINAIGLTVYSSKYNRMYKVW